MKIYLLILVNKHVYRSKEKGEEGLSPISPAGFPALALLIGHVARLGAVDIATAAQHLAALTDDIGAVLANVGSVDGVVRHGVPLRDCRHRPIRA